MAKQALIICAGGMSSSMIAKNDDIPSRKR